MIKNFMDCWDYSTEELMKMVDLIIYLKACAKKGYIPKLLKGQALAMIFNGNSTRTRISFETAAQELGASALFLTGGPKGELHLGHRETIADSARVISSMVDGIIIRWVDTEEIEEFAKNSTVPVFNGMDYMRHPTQTLCDLVTIIENLPEGKELKDIKLVFIGSADVEESSANDLAKLLPRFGATVVHLVPPEHEPGGKFDKEKSPAWMIELNEQRRLQACKEGDGHFYWTNEAEEALKDVDFIYTGCYCYEGMEDDTDMKHFNEVFIGGGYQVTEELLLKYPGAMTMHYLPALRGKEMTDYAMDFEGSLLWKQAENRYHTQRGLLAYLMGQRETVSQAEKEKMEMEAWKKIEEMRLDFGKKYTHR